MASSVVSQGGGWEAEGEAKEEAEGVYNFHELSLS